MSYLFEANWLYYSKGVLSAKVKIESNGIYYEEFENHSKTFNSAHNVDNQSDKERLSRYIFPFKILSEFICDFIDAEWLQDVVIVGEKLTYQKHNEIEGVVDNQLKKGWIWSQRNDDVGPLDIIIVDQEIICFFYTNGMGSEYIIKSGYEDLTPLKEWRHKKTSLPGRGIMKHVDAMIPMRDGIKLSTEVWLPADYHGIQKLPAILMRTPYGKKRNALRDVAYADRGYAVILQDVRGREDSEGDFIAMYHEMNDGSDTIDWIVSQEWSDGKVGMIGASYGGYVQWTAAASGNQHLKAIVSQVSAGSPFLDIERRGGGYNMGIIQWNIMMSEKKVLWDLPNINWNEELKKRPLKDIPVNITGKNLEFWDLFMAHPDYDEFWKQMTFSDHHHIDIPALVISGWHDGDINGTVEIVEMNKRNNSKNQRLILGPWEHHFNMRRSVGEYSLGNNSVIYNMDLLYLMWFDRFLKGISNDVESTKVEYYPEVLNKWIKSTHWPPKESFQKKFFLSSKNEDDQKNGELIAEEDYKNHDLSIDCRQYIYDPCNPAPQLYDPISKKPFTPMDYTSIESREDVIVYTSKVFEKDTIILGQPALTLFASSSATDTDWLGRLTRVTDDGKSYRIAEGLVRAKYRNSFEKAELLNPESIEKYLIKLPYVGQLIQKGERIRLHITSAQDGEMFPNSNTGKNPAYDCESCIALQKIYETIEHPSTLELNLLYLESVEEDKCIALKRV
ncbi:MAG: CocE/NonD family hydrolase [Eubacteriales bacterium]|nr:CocE/NonD family hydrolase [Eubacteriales bacterium]